MSWTGLGGRCLHFCPLDQEVWEYLGFDCCWVFEMQISRAELHVPLSDSAGRSGIVEDVHEWCTAHNCDGVFVEVVRYFLGGHDNGEQELLVVRVPLLWLCEQRAEVVDWSLYALDFAFFCALDDEHRAHDTAVRCYVEVQLFPFFRHRQDWW